VTVVTARGPSGESVGVTVNSFNSVSLDPPLILWSLDKEARSRAAFQASTYFAVNVLGADQADLSVRFAQRHDDKFAAVEVDDGTGGCPLIKGCVARFQCRTEQMIDGGDHLIFVGRVLEFDYDADAPALAFYRGRYCRVDSDRDVGHQGLTPSVDVENVP
jgi:3-hydroxy-9,10-secoandrosta-1,3,5(10)-triene-9,17-dione monooxygenase reductase component